MKNHSRVSSLLIICHGYPPYYGGGEGVAAGIASEVARSSSYNVTVLTSDIGGRLKEREILQGVSVIRIPAMKREWSRHTVVELLSFYVSAVRRLRSIHEEIRPDHVLAIFSMPAGLVALKWFRMFGVPYSVGLHGSDVPGYQPRRFRLLHPAMRLAVRRVWSNAENVFAVSSKLKELALKTWAKGRIEVIPNGVDTRRFHPGNPDVSFKGKVRMVLVSQLIERKGIQYLLEALAEMDPSLGEKLEVDIYGTGDYRRTLEEQVRDLRLGDCVSFNGLLETEELAKTLHDADMFALPSLQEGLPLALLEAMACGLPIVATAVGDVPSVIRDNINGCLVAPADSQALCRAVSAMVADSELRSQLGKQARLTAEDYSWDRIWARYDTSLSRGTDTNEGACSAAKESEVN
jgi:glycosyltransferase involved in cell wall biosynthesis